MEKDDEDNEWFGANAASRNLAVLTSCPEIFNWIHSNFAGLLFELCFGNVEADEKPNFFVPIQTFGETKCFWNLRKVFAALSNPDFFKDIVFKLFTGHGNVCFQSASDDECYNVAKCFNTLLPNEVSYVLRKESNYWHCHATADHDCEIVLKVIKSENLFEIVGHVERESLSSQLVRQVFEIVAKTDVDWSVAQVQLQAFRDCWSSQAKVWSEMGKSANSLRKQYLRLKSLKDADIKILDFWASLLEK